MKPFLRGLRGDLNLFFTAWWKIIFRHSYAIFSSFEKVKRNMAKVLYRQRGRFSRPFVHTAMGGIVALSVTLAPVLASSFPGVDASEAHGSVLGDSVMQTTEDSMGTVVSDKVRDRVLEYTVQNGDTLSEIADKFNVSTDTIRWENNLASATSIKPGWWVEVKQLLQLLRSMGLIHRR
jgi:hypothetical protein